MDYVIIKLITKILKVRFGKNSNTIRSYLLPDGTFLATDYKDSKNNIPHYTFENFLGNFIFSYLGKNYDSWQNYDEIEKEKIKKDYDVTDYEIQSIYDYIDANYGWENVGEKYGIAGCPLLENELGWIRLNGGVDGEKYIVIPSRENITNITYAQYSGLQKWLDNFYVDDITVTLPDSAWDWDEVRYHTFNETDTVDYIIQKIRKYYNIGKLTENIKATDFRLGTAGYILEDGSFSYVDEYHADDYDNERYLDYPEFSNTHPEDDTCIRLYKEPNDIQYKKLEQIIDKYLDVEGYCKIEIWKSREEGYTFYKIYSLWENACGYASDENEEIGNWNGYKLIQIIKNQFTLKESLLLEVTRAELMNQSRKAGQYKDGSGNRWTAKSNCKIANTVSDYNNIDMDTFFKKDILKFGIRVEGETDTYIVTILFKDILKEIQDQIKRNKNKLDAKIIYDALMRAITRSDILVGCSCLTGDTQIKLLDGTAPTIAELVDRYNAGEKLYVYSVDENGDFKPGEVEKVWKTGEAEELIEITLDNNNIIKATPNHLFMKRDGTYIEAGNLKENDSLMPLYFNYSSNGYETVKFNTEERGWHSVYKLVADYFKASEIEQVNQSTLNDATYDFPYNVAIHHKDFNKNNNNPENLQVMTGYEHWKYHALLCGDNKPVTERMREVARENAVKRNLNPTQKMLEQRKKFVQAGTASNYNAEVNKKRAEKNALKMIEYWNNLDVETRNKRKEKSSILMKESWQAGNFNTEKFRLAAKQRGVDMHSSEREELIKQGIKNYWENISEEDLSLRRNNVKKASLKAAEKLKGVPLTDEHKEKIRQASLKYNTDPIRKEEKNRKIFDSKVLKIFYSILHDNKPITEDTYMEYYFCGAPGLSKVVKKYGSLNKAISYFNINHKVTKIKHVYTQHEPVYDIKVKTWHNFLLNAGVIVHNCPDYNYRFRYWGTKNGYNAGQKETREAKLTNPNNDKGAACKHILAVLNNAEWLKKIASVINNYINYCKDHMEYNYSRFIFPKLYNIAYEKAVQLTFDDYDEDGNLKDDLKSDEAIINLSNALGKVRGRFKKGSNRNPAANK